MWVSGVQGASLTHIFYLTLGQEPLQAFLHPRPLA